MAPSKDIPPFSINGSDIDRYFQIQLLPYAKKYGLNQLQLNAAKHAVASAIYADVYKENLSAFLGDTVEVVGWSPDGDIAKDQVNNFLGRQIQANL